MFKDLNKRDHRIIGKELNLFHFQEDAPGIPFWHSKGWSIYCTIEQYIRAKNLRSGYQEVKTPLLLDKKLWELSGHWSKFKDNMFILDNQSNKSLALKPMSCPCHVQIFKQKIRSYKDLPIKLAEFGQCYRNELSGGLYGLMRVRGFTQDDGHIFCTEDQIISETENFCKLLISVYSDFGFNNIKIKFSDRPNNRVGKNEIWDKAESALKKAIDKIGLLYDYNPGEGAFYGPKIEFTIKDSIGRDWQCGTLQIDFILPESLDAYYINSRGIKERPVMIHRAIIGTFERFIGILLEESEGYLPLWLTPIQVAIATVNNKAKVNDYASRVYQRLTLAGIRSELDISSEKVNYKIRSFSSQKIPIIAVIGEQEVNNNNLTLRKLRSNNMESLSVEELINSILINKKEYLS